MNINIPVIFNNGEFSVDTVNLQSQLAEIQEKYNKDMAGIAELLDCIIAIGEVKSVSSIQKEAVSFVEETEKDRVHTNVLKFIAYSKNFVFAEGKQGPKGKIESCIKRIK